MTNLSNLGSVTRNEQRVPLVYSSAPSNVSPPSAGGTGTETGLSGRSSDSSGNRARIATIAWHLFIPSPTLLLARPL